MQAFTSLLLLSLTFSSIAAASHSEHPCSEFMEKEARAQEQVTEFDKEVRKLERKLESIEERIAKKMEEVAPLESQRRSLEQELAGLGQEQISLDQEIRLQQQSLNSIEREADQMRARIAWLRAEINRGAGPNQRAYLREANQLEHKLPSLEKQLPALRQSLIQTTSRLQQLPQRMNALSSQISQLDTVLTQHAQSMGPLQEVRARAQQELQDIQPRLDELNKKLAKASRHVQMCVGYEELSVKYPVALDVAREVYTQKCRNYRPVNFPSELENQAQMEVINSLCSR